jgi:hypothetical protein
LRPVSPRLVERLRDLALVEIDTLLARLPEDEARDVLIAYLADLEDALLAARTAIREGHAALGAGGDPLGVLEHGPERRASAGDAAVIDASMKLAQRAAFRRELARLEEVVRAVLPRLLEADRRYVALG